MARLPVPAPTFAWVQGRQWGVGDMGMTVSAACLLSHARACLPARCGVLGFAAPGLRASQLREHSEVLGPHERTMMCLGSGKPVSRRGKRLAGVACLPQRIARPGGRQPLPAGLGEQLSFKLRKRRHLASPPSWGSLGCWCRGLQCRGLPTDPGPSPRGRRVWTSRTARAGAPPDR